MESQERDREARATEAAAARLEIRRQTEHIKEELEEQRRLQEDIAEEQRLRDEERNRITHLASTGKLKASEDVRMALRCMRQGDIARAARLLDGVGGVGGALDVWPTYAWGWLAVAELTLLRRQDAAEMLSRAAREVTVDAQDAIFTLPLASEYSRLLDEFRFDVDQRATRHERDVTAYTFFVTLLSFGAVETTRKLPLQGRLGEIAVQCLIVVDPTALQAYAVKLCERVERAGSASTVILLTPQVRTTLRLAARDSRPGGSRRNAAYLIGAWCDRMLAREDAESEAGFADAVASMESTASSLEWSEPVEVLAKTKVIYEARVREREARAAAIRVEQGRKRREEAEQHARTARRRQIGFGAALFGFLGYCLWIAVPPSERSSTEAMGTPAVAATRTTPTQNAARAAPIQNDTQATVPADIAVVRQGAFPSEGEVITVPTGVRIERVRTVDVDGDGHDDVLVTAQAGDRRKFIVLRHRAVGWTGETLLWTDGPMGETSWGPVISVGGMPVISLFSGTWGENGFSPCLHLFSGGSSGQLRRNGVQDCLPESGRHRPFETINTHGVRLNVVEGGGRTVRVKWNRRRTRWEWEHR